ncbi:aminotransferase class I/II-fold pyridoxal phosphate-dependent enzyme (plasmid) [Nicoliella spurrieriana]|uniref:Aminotransferase n=1 Tax=Nicoliella spurrieriana TaxID=2925830 RepID=A0A976RQI0_9LACO|nr:aminotransferase class I/II-fold pyridoxal phosphate-dependent enzyme [Nicoliella spurrieriana]UQS86000.1 aminotransferase class I/II-fold pyridoxal phosphate-dependent enzyme [Nicoliella spurrieriana]
MDLSNQINDSVKKMKSNEIVEFNLKIADIPGLISLTYGEPDFPTPRHIKDAAIKAINDDQSHYTDPRGIKPLRENAVKFLKDKYGLDYDPDTQITTTVGLAEGIHDVFTTILNPGDEVIIPTPTYPLYAANVKFNQATPVFVDTSDSNFILTPERLEATFKEHPNAKAIIINYPNNPVGNTYTKAELEALAAVIKQHQIFLISDEIYSELTYDEPHTSFGTLLPDQTIVMNGASKTFAMTGWRIGIVCGPANIISKINAVHTLINTNATDNAQYAASEAFKNGENDALEMKPTYLKRRQLLREGLEKAGFTSPEPSGGFYIFAKIPARFEQDSYQFGYQLAKEALVGIMPGAIFGPGGDGYIRFSYAASTEELTEVVKRIQKFVDTH